jgi:hypothetical protein
MYNALDKNKKNCYKKMNLEFYWIYFNNLSKKQQKEKVVYDPPPARARAGSC